LRLVVVVDEFFSGCRGREALRRVVLGAAREDGPAWLGTAGKVKSVGRTLPLRVFEDIVGDARGVLSLSWSEFAISMGDRPRKPAAGAKWTVVAMSLV
jgi:hypothetical protein